MGIGIAVIAVVTVLYPIIALICLVRLWHVFRVKGFHIIHTYLIKHGNLGRIAAGLRPLQLEGELDK